MGIIQPFTRQTEVLKDIEGHKLVTIMGGCPCVIVETFGDEAVIKAITDGVNHRAGETWCVAKKDLMPAEVIFVDKPRDKVLPPEPDWNKIIGREREYSK